MRIFYVIYIRDEFLGGYLNAIRYISDPKEKYDAHITVRGPYEKPINVTKYNNIIKNEEIRITSVGTFFEGKQNTVFLKCEATKLKSIWQKFNYGFNPHISLYDGKSRLFAEKLCKILNSHLINFTFKADELSELRSYRGQADYRLSLEANLIYIKNKIDGITQDHIENMDENERLEKIDILTDYLSLIKAKKKLSITIDEKKNDHKNYYLNVLSEKNILNEEIEKHIINNNLFDIKILRD